jgi:hypothetical protein
MMRFESLGQIAGAILGYGILAAGVAAIGAAILVAVLRISRAWRHPRLR